MADKDQYTNNTNDEWSVKDTEQWISTTTILSIVTAFIRYTTKSTIQLYHSIDTYSRYITKNIINLYHTIRRR
jgi:hypothetical protein